MCLGDRLRWTLEIGTMETASKLPRRLKYWVTVQEIARASMDSKQFPATSIDDVLQKLDTP